MTLNEAFAAVIYGLAGTMFLSWYLWCWFMMFFRCQKPSQFFSTAYSTSSLFALVNFMFGICAAAFVLHWATN